MNTPRPRAVYVDVGDTLIAPVGFNRRHGIRALLALADELPDAPPVNGHKHLPLLDHLVRASAELTRIMERAADQTDTEYRQVDFHRVLYRSAGVTFDVNESELEWAYWEEALTFEPEPDVAAGLEEIRNAGVPVGVISNTSFSEAVIRRELERHGLLRFINLPVVTSADYGLRKPRRELFDVARGLASADVRTAGEAELWYVGNSFRHDVIGAKSAGWTAVWYNRVEDRVPEGAQQADIETRSWADVAAAVASLKR